MKSDGCAEVLGHLFYRHPDTESAQCQVYSGLHLQLGSLAMGVLPLPWRQRSGASVFVGILVPRGAKRKMRGHFKWWPKGGPDGEIAKRRRAQRIGIQKAGDA